MLVWKRIAFDDLLPAAQSGRVDVVCATLGVTPERGQQVDFSRPYFRTELVVLVREAPDQPQTLRDLDAKKVAASPNTTSQRAIARLLPESTGVFAPDRERTDVQRLLDGEVDAIVMDGPAAETVMAARSGQNQRLCAGSFSAANQVGRICNLTSPRTSTTPGSCPSGLVAGALRASGTQPRLTHTIRCRSNSRGV